jgi:hypothetical protein
MFDVEIETKVGDAVCRARLKLENDYPMMQITELV